MNSSPAGHPVATPLMSRCFTTADQRNFAAMSGDINPMHMDPLAARRMQAGEPVVHGIHVLLWALDVLARTDLPIACLQNLKVQFGKFIYLDRPLALEVRQRGPGKALVVVTGAGLSVMTLMLRFGPRAGAVLPCVPHLEDALPVPDELSLEQMTDRAGRLFPPVGAEAFERAFPDAAATLDPRRLSALAQLSRLVGMVCPGLHSIFAGLSLEFPACTGPDNGVAYRVSAVDSRFRVVTLAVEGEGLSGQVSTYARWAPVEAPGMAVMARHVSPDAFAGSNSLVAGGSRGLGAITAKLLAAGGGRVTVTYARGREDAERLVTEINTAKGEGCCAAVPFDATLPVAPQFEGAEAITHLYYFVTPQIFVQKSEVFLPDLYAEFSLFYVNAFYDLCRMLLVKNLTVFYPSSIAVEARPPGLTEYSMAKMAGEMLCADMMASMPGLRVLINRLPRVLTDQTASVAQVANADPIEIMLPLLEAMHTPA